MNYFRTLLFSCLVMAGLGWQSARAATFTWDGGLSHGNLTLNDFWSTTNNWVNGVPVSGVGTDLVFTLSGVQVSATQNLAEPFTLSSMTFNSASNVFLVRGGTLNFVPAAGSTYSIKHESDNPTTIQNAVPVP